MASQSPKVTETSLLYKLQYAVDGGDFQLLKLGAELLGVPVGHSDKALSLVDLKRYLDDHVTRTASIEGKGLALLVALADTLGLPASECQALQKAVRDYDSIISDWELRKEFRYTRLIMKVCTEISVGDFPHFRELSLASSGKRIANDAFPNLYTLFRKLSDLQIVTPDNVDQLHGVLDVMGKERLLGEIDVYKKSIGQLSQPSDSLTDAPNEGSVQSTDQGDAGDAGDVGNDLPNQALPGNDLPNQAFPGNDLPNQALPGNDLPNQANAQDLLPAPLQETERDCQVAPPPPGQPTGGAGTALGENAPANINFAHSFLNVSDQGYTGRGVLIGVVDTGINSSHKAFRRSPSLRKIAMTKNFLEGEDDAHTDTRWYHGSGVAGIAAGRPLQFTGYNALNSQLKNHFPGYTLLPVGVAKEASLVVCRVAETKDTFEPGAVARALNWIHKHNQPLNVSSEDNFIRIVVISARLDCDHTGVREAIERLADQGVLCVAGVGNDGGGPKEAGWPARYPSVLAVGSCTPGGNESDFSTRRPLGVADVYTIGEKVLLPKDGDEGFWVQNGTSFAAPAIAGLVAVLLERARKECQGVGPAVKMLTTKDKLVKFFQYHMTISDDDHVLRRVVHPEIFWAKNLSLEDVAKVIMCD